MKLTIQTNFPDIDRMLRTLPESVASRAGASTLNKVTAQAQTQMTREITSEFNLTARKVKEKLAIRRASFKGGRFLLEAELYSFGKRRAINLINFGARQSKSKGVTVKIRKQGGRVPVKGAFIANSGRTVFKRVGQTRLPIKPVQTIDVQQMFNTKRINSRVVAFILKKLPEVFEREATFYLSRFGT